MPEIEAESGAYLTDGKRVDYLGSARGGTAHHWAVTISSAALVLLVPLFLFTFGRILGAPWPEVVAYYQHPFPALVAIGTFAVSGYHFRQGVQVLITDYTRGLTRKIAIVAAVCVAYGLAAIGVVAVVLLALAG
jgi:succinate dehydrogenase / fumarate reductase membrane anchor subunit